MNTYESRITCNCGYEGPGPHNCAGVWQDEPSFPHSTYGTENSHGDLRAVFRVLEQIRDELRAMRAET